MLNTDLHSPQIRKRMTIEDYGKNLKGVNDKEDFSPEYIVRCDFPGLDIRQELTPCCIESDLRRYS